MRIIFILIGNEVRRFLHDKPALSLTFLVPVVLIYIFGHVFGVNGEGMGPREFRSPWSARRTRPSLLRSRQRCEKRKPSKSSPRKKWASANCL